MESLYFLLPLSLVVLAVGIALFFWAVRSGQYDDLDGDGERILFDDAPARDAADNPAGTKPAPGRPANTCRQRLTDGPSGGSDL